MNVQLHLVALLLLAVLAHGSVIKQNHVNRSDADRTPWELTEAIYGSSGLLNFNGTWITDSEFYYTASDKSIHKYNAANKSDGVFVGSKFLDTYTGATFTLSHDNTKILVRYNVTAGFRHSYKAQYDIYDIEKETAIKIHGGEKLQHCGWSHSRDRLAYVFENNVYIHFSENLEIPITNDGIEGVVYNGVPDWVYEEEMLSSGSALWWSPDGNKLAVGFFNDTKVQTFKYFMYGTAQDPNYQYPQEVDLKYPKAGTKNPVVSVRVFDLSTVEPLAVSLTAPIEVVSSDHILGDVAWSNSSHLIVTWLNRRQNVSTLQSCSVEGKCVEAKRFEEPKGWVIVNKPKCLSNGTNCIFPYWIDNWYQVWKLNLESGENTWKSRGNFTVLTVYGYDEVRDKLYYQATTANNTSVKHVFSNDDCLSCNIFDIEGEACESASASFSKNFSYYVLGCNGPNPNYIRIFDSVNHTLVKDWEPNLNYRQKISAKLRPIYKYINVTLADGSISLAKLALPPSFNESSKYPLIVVVYGGPNSYRVTTAFTTGYEAFVTTKREVIYAYIDGRGTANKGKDFLFSVNNDLGDYEVEDQLFVTKWLQDNFTFVDRERTGIWGWSYGGYMTAKIIEKDDDRIFQCGVSVAPVTSWLYYDTIYTERFMGLPTDQDNKANYNRSSVFNRLDNFKTHDFFLIHGSGDDNVHYQNSLLLAKLLQRADIAFEEQTYTDENHSIGNALPHLYNSIDHFWTNCLNLDEGSEDAQ